MPSDLTENKSIGRKTNNQVSNKNNISSTQSSKTKKISKQNIVSEAKNAKIRNKVLTGSNDNNSNENYLNMSEKNKNNLSIFTSNSKKFTDFGKSEKSEMENNNNNNNIMSMEKISPQNKNNTFNENRNKKSKPGSGRKKDNTEIFNSIEGSESKAKVVNHIDINSQKLKYKNKVIKNTSISPKNKTEEQRINMSNEYKSCGNYSNKQNSSNTKKNSEVINNFILQNSKINEMQINENQHFPNSNNFDFNTINNDARNYCELNNGLQLPAIYTSAVMSNPPQMLAINGNEMSNVITPTLLFSNPQLIYQHPNLFINHRKTAVVNNVNINNLVQKKNLTNQKNIVNNNNNMYQNNIQSNYQQMPINNNSNKNSNNQDAKNIKKMVMKKENSALIEFLSQINMLKYLNNLINNGFDDINLFIEVAKGGEVIKDQELKEAGVNLPGDRAKILIRLQEKANCFGFAVPKLVYYTCQDLENIDADKNINKLKNWLVNLKMEDYLMNFISNGYHTIELLLMQMETSNPLTNEILKDEIGIEKIGYRSRIINKLKDEGRSLKHKLLASALIVNSGESNKNCECFIY